MYIVYINGNEKHYREDEKEKAYKIAKLYNAVVFHKEQYFETLWESLEFKRKYFAK